MPVRTTVWGANIRTRRLANGWPQHELARRLGVGQPVVSLWESGDRTPDPHHQAQLLALFGLKQAATLFPDGGDTDTVPMPPGNPRGNRPNQGRKTLR